MFICRSLTEGVASLVNSGITTQSSAQDTTVCTGWTIAIKDIPELIKECKTITGQEWHHMFDVLPCIISGQLKQNGQSFKLEINGGSWMSVTVSDTTILLGNYRKHDEKYFISKVWDGGNKTEVIWLARS
jgi:hypothetical protein